MRCNRRDVYQTDCKIPAAFRYAWPDRPEGGVCSFHLSKLKEDAEFAGIALKLEPIPLDAPDGELSAEEWRKRALELEARVRELEQRDRS